MEDEALNVRRYDHALGDTVHVVDGIRVYGETPYRTFVCRGSLQPASGDDLVQPVEGTYQTTQLTWYVWKDGPDWPTTGDYVERDGLYIVAGIEEWGSYVKVRLSRDDKTTAAL